MPTVQGHVQNLRGGGEMANKDLSGIKLGGGYADCWCSTLNKVNSTYSPFHKTLQKFSSQIK